MMKISVNSPSYKRPDKVGVLKYLSFCRVWVSEDEYGEYVKHNKKENIICVPRERQGNVSRIRNHIIDEEFKRGIDVVVIVDDDLMYMGYWQNNKRFKIEENEFLDFVLRYSVLAEELGVYLWGVNLNCDKQNYREYTPFSLTSPVLGPFQCFLADGGCRYDERLYLKEDYDMTLQQLEKHRKVLRANKYFYDAKQSEQEGGCATQRSLIEEEKQFRLLQKKWGKMIVKRDGKDRSNKRKKKKTIKDYNPIIRVPINGI